MKKLLLSLMLIIFPAVMISGCQKSDREKIDEIREEQNIDILSDKQALEHIVEGKKAVIEVFQGVSGDEEVLDEFETPYRPFIEKYNSPEKIREALGKYYEDDYVDRLVDLIPAEYIEGVYMIPVGDIGMIPNYDDIFIVERRDITEKSISIEYKLSEKSEEYYISDFGYADRSWKIKGEAKGFDQE